MIEQEITLLTNGRISFQKCGNGLQFGYSKNRGVYSIKVKTSGEWNGLTIRAFWHIPDIKEPITSLLVDNVIRVPALVTSYKGEGRIVFEGSDGAKTVTSADVRYYVNKNSGTCDGTIPEPGTPAWQELVGTVKKYSDTAVEAKESAKKSADEAKQALEDTKDVKSQAIEEINSSKTAVIEEIENKKNLSIEEINSVKEDAKGELEALCDSTRDFANQAKEAADRAKASETKAQEYSNLSQSNANASSESASNAKASEDASKKNADDSAATLQELKDGIASGDFKGDKGDPGPAGKDAPQIDDTTVTDSAPWSSKHIVDMLCPPISETGNPVVCYPVENYPLGVTASWEPVQEGSGDPSPDNIRPIKGRDAVKVERCGENLLDVAQCRVATPSAAYGLTVTVDDTGLIRVFGIPEVNKDIPQATFRILFTNQVILTKEYKAKWFVVKGVINAITPIQKDKSIVLQSPLLPNTSVDVQFRLMYYTGDEPTTYAPYTGQTSTLTLPRTIYGGTVDAVSGESSRTWRTITLTGEERAHIYSIFFYLDLSVDSSFVIEKPADGKTGKSSHYPYAVYSYNCIGFTADGKSLTYASNGKYPLSDEGLQEWKSYLAAQYAAGTPVQVCYKLAEPVPFTATGAQPIPALSGVNTVLTDADTLTVTGRADPIKRITDLEDAVASMTNT